ncbi:MAG: hypothetical protein SPI30_01415 [Prevotella sp.]|nr:hypothetical protein [Prevotella sp.]
MDEKATSRWYGVYRWLVVCVPTTGTGRTNDWYDDGLCRLDVEDFVSGGMGCALLQTEAGLTVCALVACLDSVDPIRLLETVLTLFGCRANCLSILPKTQWSASRKNGGKNVDNRTKAAGRQRHWWGM